MSEGAEQRGCLLDHPQDHPLSEAYLLRFVCLRSRRADESLEFVESEGDNFSIIGDLGGNGALRTIRLPN